MTAALSAGSPVALGDDQANYLLKVLRMKEGDAVVLFNGRDGAWLAKIAETAQKSVTLEAVVQTAHQTPASDLWFGFAPLKTGRLDYVVQKATEMGAGIIQPVITQYTQISRLKQDKLEAYALEAAEQCEVLSLPVVRARDRPAGADRGLAHHPGPAPPDLCRRGGGLGVAGRPDRLAQWPARSAS